MFEKEKKQYAEDCKTHERPWELWQGALAHEGNLNWVDLYREPNWDEFCIYRRKQTTFVPEYYSGLNWKDAEHLVGKIIEYSDFPGKGWKVGKLKKLNKIGENFVVNTKRHCVFSTYIRTVSKHPTINIGGVELPMPETKELEVNDTYWIFYPFKSVDLYHRHLWMGIDTDRQLLSNGLVHLTEDRAKAWSDWWKTVVIDKMK